MNQLSLTPFRRIISAGKSTPKVQTLTSSVIPASTGATVAKKESLKVPKNLQQIAKRTIGWLCIIAPAIATLVIDAAIVSPQKAALSEAKTEMTQACKNNSYEAVQETIDKCGNPSILSPGFKKSIGCFQQATQACKAEKQ